MSKKTKTTAIDLVKNETFLTYITLSLAFLIPVFIGHPQSVVGSIINMFLVLAAIKFNKLPILGVTLLPSLGAISRGLLFGPFTHLLLYMVPFIWLGNLILVLSFTYLYKKKRINYFVTLGIGAMSKYLLLFGSSYLLVSAKILPKLFLTSMGISQFITASIGGVLAYTVLWKLKIIQHTIHE